MKAPLHKCHLSFTIIPILYRYDVVNDALESGLLGRAYRDNLCTSHRVSINEDVGIYRTAQVGAHELGHKYDNSYQKFFFV